MGEDLSTVGFKVSVEGVTVFMLITFKKPDPLVVRPFND
jgi:hypothetical protein